MKYNLHSHTYLCHHAVGDIEDYIIKAIECNYKIYGISDHAYLPDNIIARRGEYPWLRYQMTKEEFYEYYLPTLDKVIEKYQNEIKIYKGIEVEYTFNNDKYYQELKSNLDYLILGIHFLVDKDNELMGTRGCKTIEELDLCCNTTIKAMESGYFDILAHPDIFMYSYPKFDSKCEEISRKIIESAIKNNVILEINCEGIRKALKEGLNPYSLYPNYEFWKIAKEYKDLKVIIGLDSHDPKQLSDETYNLALALVNDLNIKLYQGK